MSSLKKKRLIFNFSQKNYSEFKSNIKSIKNELSNLKFIDYKNEIKDLMVLTEDKENELFCQYLLFINYPKWILSNIDCSSFNSTSFNKFATINIDNNKDYYTKRTLKLIFHMYLYILMQLEKNILYTVEKDANNKMKEINELFHLLTQIIKIILKLYQEKIYSLNHLLIFSDAIIVYVKKNSIIDDKYIKIKNLILFELLFDKLYGNILQIMSKIDSENQDDMNLFIDYIIKYFQSNEIKSNFNFLILNHNKTLIKLISTLLYNIDYSRNAEIYKKYKNELINCLTNIYKHDEDESNFFEILINQNKTSFINLVNYTTRKDNIIKDLYIQNFYIELLSKLFSNEVNSVNNMKNKTIEILPPENSFIFNGYSSKMVFQLNKFSLENSVLFFSFRLNDDLTKDNSSGNLPLIIFESNSPTNMTFKIFIKRENGVNKLMIYHEKKNEKNPKLIELNKIENISPKTNYYIGLKFLEKKAIIHMKKVDENGEKYYEQEIEIFNFKIISALMQIGHDNTKNEFFKGYIGSFMVISDLSVKKTVNHQSIISSVLELKDYYKIFPYLLNKSADFDIDNYFYFLNIKEENKIKNIISFIQTNIDDFECTLYITPEILKIYHSLVLKYETAPLPIIPLINISQGLYVIFDIDISTTKFKNVYIEFQKNNGFYYFSLIYEYFYQFFTLMSSSENRLLDLKKDDIENIIINTINSTLLILGNYNDFKIILNNLKAYKTLFKTFFETIKKISKSSNNIMQFISKSTFELFLNLKNELIEFQKQPIKNYDSTEALKSQEIVFSFSDGLVDMLFDTELYLNYENENYLNMLFIFSTTFVMNYLGDKDPLKILPFKPEFIFKILNLFKIIEKSFSNDIHTKNKTIDSFFKLLKYFYRSIINEENAFPYFRILVNFSVINHENNLAITYNFLKFINDMLFQQYSLENIEIELLLNYHNKLGDKFKEEKYKEIMDEINSIISGILLKTLLFSISDKNMINYIFSKLEQFLDNEVVIVNIISEIDKIFEKLLKVGIYEFKKHNLRNKNNNDNTNYMELFGNLFKFILILFRSLINKYENDSQNEESSKRCLEKLFYSLSNIKDLLKNELNIKRKNSCRIYCLINFIILFHHIVFNEIKIFQISDKIIYLDILLQIIQLCSDINILNSNAIFKVKKENNECKKTIIEIIFELYMKYILIEDCSIECSKKLLKNFENIFYNKQFIDKKKSIFYENDYLRYLLSQKKVKEKAESILLKYETLSDYNKDILKSEEKFDINFTTYFLTLIIDTQKLKQNNQKFDKKLSELFDKFMNQLFSDILKEQKDLSNIDKKYFFKTSSSILYNEQISYIRDKYIKKNISEEVAKSYIESIPEKLKNSKQILQDNKGENNNNESKDENNNKQEIIDEIQDADKDIKKTPLEFPNDINKIRFFNDIDTNYIINIKKDIMNNIFGLYYIDNFYYNQDFCKMKKYYINFINLNKTNNSKQLNFPSIIKNYKNNLESPIFIKQFNNFFTDPYLSITHSYVDSDLNNKISRQKSIKLIEKAFPKSDNDKEIECEILKNENTYFGKLIYNNIENYLIFKEEFKDYTEEEKLKYIFMVDYFWFNNYNKNDKKRAKAQKFREKTRKKNVVILLDEIEEIIEMRILLLWKGLEIYLKNGKSYLFNFLTTTEYGIFMNDFINKSKLKNIVKKRDFLSEKNILYEEWKKGLIPNYDYILLLNRYSSRSYNDPTQYPVFPWLLNDYKLLETFNNNDKYYSMAYDQMIRLKDDIEDQNVNMVRKNSIKFPKFTSVFDSVRDEKYEQIDIFSLADNERKKVINNEQYYSLLKEIVNNAYRKLRDFNYPISLQTTQKRINAMKKYNEDKEEGTSFPIHSGCHYSNSAYIYFYLMRQQPYDNLIIKLQEYNQENTNRCFSSFSTLLVLTGGGNDNRELIPDFFTKIEYFMNLNCDFYGILDISKLNLDDCELDIFNNRNTTYIPTYVYFILQHKKLINSKTIGHYLNHWFDIIFGINQLPPEKTRAESCNIFSKQTYEQKLNLESKLEKKKEKGLTPKEIYSKLFLNMSHLINFGITPTQLFRYPHEELINYKPSENNNNRDRNDMLEEEEDEGNDDIEEMLINIHSESLTKTIKNSGTPIYFSINPTINKIFIYNSRDNIIIFDCSLFNELYPQIFSISDTNYKNVNSNIIYTKENSVYQIKYSFSSFYDEINYDFNLPNNENKIKYHTYYFEKINFLLNRNKIYNTKKNIDNFKIITCRHLDSSFQIHYITFTINKKKKQEINQQIFSFFCEDFISSCCCISNDTFILGLINGKIIFYKLQLYNIEVNISDKKQSKKKNETKLKMDIKKLKYIQGHRGKINSIDVDKRLGIIITSGDDNYINIRKLYDFELLLPIKIKSKYNILMIKTSPFNFFYVLCFNKRKNQKRIFGYTFSGLRFAKSEYGAFDNISINEDGNIITLENQEIISMLSGNDLSKLNTFEQVNSEFIPNQIRFKNWLQYDCFFRNGEEEMSKIITYFSGQSESFNINTSKLSDIGI